MDYNISVQLYTKWWGRQSRAWHRGSIRASQLAATGSIQAVPEIYQEAKLSQETVPINQSLAYSKRFCKSSFAESPNICQEMLNPLDGTFF